jgi:4-amino-4-deoxy-L-arabinose transferase-like glycosyltransferase
MHHARFLAGVLGLAVLVIWFQSASGAWHSDLAGNEDEPSHAVSSLMVRDYLARGLTSSPLRFAEDYYLHYPKVGIGHWPPLFYFCQAAWMLLFGRSKLAMLALMAFLAVVLAAAVLAWTQRTCGLIAGFFIAALLVTSPLVQAQTFSVGPDLLLALLCFLAVAAFGTYLETAQPSHGLLCAALALSAVATHGRGTLLVFVPLAMSVLDRRWVVSGVYRLLAIALSVLAVFLPQWMGQSAGPSPGSALDAAVWFPWRAGTAVGWPLILLAAVGALAAFRLARERQRWIAILALLLSVWFYHIVVSVGWDNRYLMPAALAIAVLAGAGWRLLSGWAARRPWQRYALNAVSLVLACGILAQRAGSPVQKSSPGYDTMLQAVFAAGDPGRVFLVAGDAAHEGSLIAHLALREREPAHVVLRASRALASSDWLGSHYRAAFPNVEALSHSLDASPVALVVTQRLTKPLHMRQLDQALQPNGTVWREVQTPAIPPDTRLFRRTGLRKP